MLLLPLLLLMVKFLLLQWVQCNGCPASAALPWATQQPTTTDSWLG
jgi:hypothetical protein